MATTVVINAYKPLPYISRANCMFASVSGPSCEINTQDRELALSMDEAGNTGAADAISDAIEERSHKCAGAIVLKGEIIGCSYWDKLMKEEA